MSTVTALEAKTRLGELLKRVASGEEIVITRHDKPVARLVPEGSRSLGEVRQAIDALRSLRESARSQPKGKPPLSNREIQNAIDQGRL